MGSENPVVHFEMPYEDVARVTEFYSNAFGWGMQNAGEAMGNYVVAETTKTENMRPITPGVINGGFFPKSQDMPAQYPSVVIAVEDIGLLIKKDYTDDKREWRIRKR